MIIPPTIPQQQQVLQLPLISSSLGLFGASGLGFIAHSLPQVNEYHSPLQCADTTPYEIMGQQHIPLQQTMNKQPGPKDSELMNEILFGDLDDLFNLQCEETLSSSAMTTPVLTSQYDPSYDMPISPSHMQDGSNNYCYHMDHQTTSPVPYSTRYSCVPSTPSSPIPISTPKPGQLMNEFSGTLCIPSSPSLLSQSLPTSLEKREKNRLAAEKSRKKRQDMIKYYTEANMELRVQSKALQLQNEQLESKLDQLIQILVANGISTIKSPAMK